MILRTAYKDFTMTGTKNLFSAGGVVLNKRGNIWKHEKTYID